MFLRQLMQLSELLLKFISTDGVSILISLTFILSTNHRRLAEQKLTCIFIKIFILVGLKAVSNYPFHFLHVTFL